MPWDQLRLVAAGVVQLTEEEREEHERLVWHRTGYGCGAVPFAGYGCGAVPFITTNIREHLNEKERLVLEVFLDPTPGRLRLLGHAALYDYLGSRRQRLYLDNFTMLVQDLTGFATGAILNRGAAAIKARQTTVLRYPTRHAFEEEIIWWRWANRTTPRTSS